MAVDRERRPRKRACPERQHINALIAIDQTVDIPLEHGHVSHQMMREQNRLGTPQMRIPRNNRVQIILRLPDQCGLRLMQRCRSAPPRGYANTDAYP